MNQPASIGTRTRIARALAAALLVGAASCQIVSGASDTKFVPVSGTGGSATGAGGHGGQGGHGGSPAMCSKASDCPGVDTGCTPRACSDGKCGTVDAALDASCTDDGGKVCDGMGKCVACNADAQCKSTEFCSMATHACRPKACKDALRDGFETDVDCGGKECDPCANGKGCFGAIDCKSGFCKPLESGAGGAGGAGAGGAGGMGAGGGMLAEPTGVCLACEKDPDCAGLPGTYCTKGVCTPQKKIGIACAGANECASGFCADKVCCDVACNGACASCVAADTGGADGSCGPVKAGTDPAGECNISAQGTCGAKGAGCNGDAKNPRCVLWDAGTECIAQTCKDALHVTAHGTCDGGGSCKPGATSDCGDYKCQGKACLAACAGDGDCIDADYCAGQSCAAKKATGASCGGANQCKSGFCVDGVCCDGACNGACAACSKAKGADVDGACKAAAVKSADDPGTCDAANGACANKPCSCDAAGACKNALGSTCGSAAQCASGFCPGQDGVCCNTACGGTCQACLKAKFSGQNDGTCGFIMAGKDPDNECLLNCNGAGSCL